MAWNGGTGRPKARAQSEEHRLPGQGSSERTDYSGYAGWRGENRQSGHWTAGDENVQHWLVFERCHRGGGHQVGDSNQWRFDWHPDKCLQWRPKSFADCRFVRLFLALFTGNSSFFFWFFIRNHLLEQSLEELLTNLRATAKRTNPFDGADIGVHRQCIFSVLSNNVQERCDRYRKLA